MNGCGVAPHVRGYFLWRTPTAPCRRRWAWGCTPWRHVAKAFIGAANKQRDPGGQQALQSAAGKAAVQGYIMFDASGEAGEEAAGAPTMRPKRQSAAALPQGARTQRAPGVRADAWWKPGGTGIHLCHSARKPVYACSSTKQLSERVMGWLHMPRRRSDASECRATGARAVERLA